MLRGEEIHTASKTRSIATLAGPIDMLIMPPRTSFGKYLHTVKVKDLLLKWVIELTYNDLIS